MLRGALVVGSLMVAVLLGTSVLSSGRAARAGAGWFLCAGAESRGGGRPRCAVWTLE